MIASSDTDHTNAAVPTQLVIFRRSLRSTAAGWEKSNRAMGRGQLSVMLVVRLVVLGNAGGRGLTTCW
jgi:hypothetical protein